MSTDALTPIQFPHDLAELEALFVQGRVPHPPLDGRYKGVLVRTTTFPLLDLLTAAIGSVYMGWLGKRFDATRQRGDNHFLASSRPSISAFWSRYPGVTDNPDGTIDAFVFRTWTGPGLTDPGTTVLKIDYDSPTNPYTLRRVLVELVLLP